MSELEELTRRVLRRDQPAVRAPVADPKAEKEKAARDNVRPREISELMLLAEPTWLVEGVVSEFALGQIIGVQKKGKTHFALDLALHIAMGLEFHGHAVVRKRVVYIIAEGSPARFFDRVRAWCYQHNVDVHALQGWFAVTYVKVKVDKRDDLRLWARAVESSGKPGIIFIDTVARNMAGNESEAQDMGAFVDGADFLRELFGCACLVLHHIGKDASKGGRGSSALPGAVDVTITVTQNAKRQIAATITEFREGAEGEKFIYEMVQHIVDESSLRTSVTLNLLERVRPGEREQQPEEEVGPVEKLIMEKLGERGGVNAMRHLASDEPGMSEANVGKLVRKLVERGMVSKTSPYVLTPRGEQYLADAG